MAGIPLADLDATLANAAPVGRRNGPPINIPNIDGNGEYAVPLAPQQPVMVQGNIIVQPPPEEFAPVPPVNITVTLGYLNPQRAATLYEAEQDDSDDDVEDPEDAEDQEVDVHVEPDQNEFEQVAGQEVVPGAAVIFNARSIAQDRLAVGGSHDNEDMLQDINPNMDRNILQPKIDIPDQLTGTAASLDVLPSLQSGLVSTRKRLAVVEDGLKGELSHVDSQHTSPQKRFAVDKKDKEPVGSSNLVGASSSLASRSEFRLARWGG